MGTRNLTCVVYQSEIKIAKYCQWDGYPSGQGSEILKFLKEKFNKPLFVSELQKVKEITEEELNSKWQECGAAPNSPFISIEVSNKFNTKYPHLARDMGAGILEAIQVGKVPSVQNSVTFANDSLFCEWAYLIDLDNETLEVYKGFNQTPLSTTDRFYQESNNSSEYYPVKLTKIYKLNELPSLEAFIEDLEGEETD